MDSGRCELSGNVGSSQIDLQEPQVDHDLMTQRVNFNSVHVKRARSQDISTFTWVCSTDGLFGGGGARPEIV